MMRTFLAGVLLAGSIAPAMAGPIPFDTWLEFGFTAAGTAASGCDPADPAGPFCISSSGTATTFLDAPAWTFAAGTGGASLTVVDAFLSGDRFEVFDFGVSLGLTSLPGFGDCSDDPVVCLASVDASRLVVALGAGLHSLTIIPTLVPDFGGAGYMFVSGTPDTTPVPAPAAWLLLMLGLAIGGAHTARAATLFGGPTSSQPLALTADDAFLVVANPDNNTVTFFDLRADRNRKLAEVPVQIEPNGVAFLPDGKKVYVANTVSGTVSVIPTNIANGVIGKPNKHIAVGVEPYGLALTPNGTKLHVTNSRSNSVSVIDTATDTVIKTIFNVGPEPRGLAITNSGDASDLDETVYVTQFLSRPIAGRIDGRDDAKAGHVTRLATATDTALGEVLLNPLADTGFKALGDALARFPPGDPANPANFKFTTGAYPNQLNNVAIKGGFAFLPNTGASPNGPVRFDVNTQSLLCVIDRTSNLDAARTINLHLAVKNQLNPSQLFITQPWAMAFENAADAGFIVSAASDHVVKVAVDPTSGAATVQSDPLDPTRVLQIKVGKNPRGIVINSADTRAYVMNYISRSVSVLDLTTAPEQVRATLQSASLPAPGTQAEKIQIGKELYNTSIGEFDPVPGGTDPIVGRMSANGWGSCAACHTPFGLSDNVVWIFPSGPRRTIAQHADFDQTAAARDVQRVLNWSAERDEQEDFELNIRGVSGGPGLLVQSDGISPDPDVFNLTPLASGARNQLRVRGVPAWDALKAFVQFGIRAPKAAAPFDPDVFAGRALFVAANCQQCHGGPQWTRSRVRFQPPPSTALTVNGQLFGELRNVGTFDPAGFNEVRQNGSPSLGASGFAPPSLLSLHAFSGTFLHNGAASSLDEVLNNVTHRSAGTGGVDTLTNAADRSKIVRFLLSIDATTLPIL